MFIKLQPDQVTHFWEPIKHGMIEANKIPEESQQDFTLKALEHLLSGLTQCWIGFQIDDNGNKKLSFIMTTKIVDEKHHGIRVFSINTLYGFRLISEELVSEINDKLSGFAKANNCNVIAVETNVKRVKGFLISQEFEEHSTIYRKFLS